MSAIINTSSFHSDLLPLVKTWFGMSYPNVLTFHDKIMKVEAADARAYQIDALVQGMGLMQRKDEAQPFALDLSKEGIKPTYQHVTYGLGFLITMEMMEDGDAFRNAKKFTEMLKFSALQTKEIIAANVYNNAFSGSFLMQQGDGVSMISTSHPTAAGNQSNLISGGSVDISEAALEQITIDIKNMKNARGLRVGAMPDKLLVSVSDEPAAHRILDGRERSATADRDINYLNSQSKIPGGIIANPFFTDSDAFFVTTNVPEGLKFLVRKELAIDTANDFSTKNAEFSAIMRISTGWTDFRGVYGSAGV